MVYILCKNRSASVARIFRKPLRAVAFGNNQFDVLVKPNGCIGSNTTIATYCDQVHWSTRRFENLSYINWTDKSTNIYYDLFNPDRGFNQKKENTFNSQHKHWQNIRATNTHTHTHKKDAPQFATFELFLSVSSHHTLAQENQIAMLCRCRATMCYCNFVPSRITLQYCSYARHSLGLQQQRRRRPLVVKLSQ